MKNYGDQFYIVMVRDIRVEKHGETVGPWCVRDGFKTIGSAKGVATRIRNRDAQLWERARSMDGSLPLSPTQRTESKVLVANLSELAEVTDDLQVKLNVAEGVLLAAGARAADLERRLKNGEATEKKPRKRRKTTEP